MATTKKKELSAAEKASKADEELREVHAGIREKWTTHLRTETSATVTGVDGDELSIHTAAGRCFIEGKVELDQDGVIDLYRKVNTALQAVS